MYIPEVLVTSEVNSVVPLESTSLVHALVEALGADNCILF